MESTGSDSCGDKLAQKTRNSSPVPFSDSEKNDVPIQEFVSSESKTPLKTPVKDGNEAIQVKYVGEAMTEVNGDAKISMDDMKACFSGMSKEELLQYVNDPFWVRMRMFLFVIFWITWIAMLVGAITIIVIAPKCDPPARRKMGPIYDVDFKSFLKAPADANGLLNAFIEKMTYLTELNVKGVILSPIYKTDKLRDNYEDVIDFKSLDEKYGTVEDFKNLIKEAKSKDIYVLLSLVPNHSSDKHAWFNKSIAREVPYNDYYVWAPGAGTGSDGSKLPPNNWLSVTGGSAWEWNDERQEFYLHQFDVNQPDLNFRNPNVLKEFNETIKFWLDLGVSGFNIDKAQYLLEDIELQDEQISRNKEGVVHTDYNFYYHSKTYNLPENAAILSKWKEAIHNKLDTDGILMITGEAPIPSDSDVTTEVVDVARSNKLSDLPRDFTAADLYSRLEKLIQNSDKWPVFQLGEAMKSFGDYFNEEDIDGLHIITSLIKGAPIIMSGEELGPPRKSLPLANETDGMNTQTTSEENHLNIFKVLMRARESKAVIYGSTNITMLNDSIITLTRVKAGYPGYMAAYNLSPENITTDFSTIEHVPEELMAYAISSNYADKTLRVKDKVKSNEFVMNPRSAVLFTFVPYFHEDN